VTVSRLWVQGEGHSSEKAAACNSKSTGRKLLRLIGISVTLTLEVIRSFWHCDLDLLTLRHLFVFLV